MKMVRALLSYAAWRRLRAASACTDSPSATPIAGLFLQIANPIAVIGPRRPLDQSNPVTKPLQRQRSMRRGFGPATATTSREEDDLKGMGVVAVGSEGTSFGRLGGAPGPTSGAWAASRRGPSRGGSRVGGMGQAPIRLKLVLALTVAAVRRRPRTSPCSAAADCRGSVRTRDTSLQGRHPAQEEAPRAASALLLAPGRRARVVQPLPVVLLARRVEAQVEAPPKRAPRARLPSLRPHAPSADRIVWRLPQLLLLSEPLVSCRPC